MDTNVTFSHTRDFFYTGMFGMQDNSFDHGSVRMMFNVKESKTCPGQFKLDPFLIKTGALDSIIKQTIYEANLFTTENEELMKIYEDRNSIVVPFFKRIYDIEVERTEVNNPGLYEEEEHYIIGQIDAEDRKLQKLEDLITMNESKADLVLNDIQNGVVTKVKTAQLQLKKKG